MRFVAIIDRQFPGPGGLHTHGSVFSGDLCHILAQPKVKGTQRPDWMGLLLDRLQDDAFSGYPGVRFWFLPRWLPFSVPLLVVWDPCAVKSLLSYKNHDYRAPKLIKGRAYDIAAPLIGKGLLSSEGPGWHQQRRLADGGFRNDVLKRVVSVVCSVVGPTMDRWDALAEDPGKVSKAASCPATCGGELAEQGVVEVVEEMLKVTMDVLGEVGFGYSFNSTASWASSDALLYACSLTMFPPQLPPHTDPFSASTSTSLRLNLALTIQHRYDSFKTILSGLSSRAWLQRR
jgi:cytochrome P450